MKYIVIGAGIAGASTAYHLAKLGAETIIVDRKDVGQATGAAAGIICPWLSQRRNATWYRLVKEGARYYPALIDELQQLGETETGYSQVGALLLRENPDKLAELSERAHVRKEDAPEIGATRICDEKETRDLFPPLAHGYHALHVSGAARVDGRALRDALIRSAIKLGASYIEGDATLNYCTEENRVKGVIVDGKSLSADKIIVCAGAWAGKLLQPLGIHMPIRRQKAQIAHLRVSSPSSTGHWPVVMPPSDQYLLAFDEGRIVVGATHEDVTEDDDDTRVTAGGLQELMNKALLAAPGLASAELLQVRVGFRPFTPGFLPVFGAIPEWEGLYTVNGLGASGLTAGPYLGKQLALLACGLSTDIDPQDYDPRQAMQ
ncbi:NAD(P)/FAD-dependent oxidoreductase [Paenibacillus sp. strain BS8-2]